MLWLHKIGFVNHRYRVSENWYGFVWAWHSKNWRVGWIIFGINHGPTPGRIDFVWPHHSRNL